MQPHQATVKGDGQQPNQQREDKKKAELMPMKQRKRMATMRLIMGSPVMGRPDRCRQRLYASGYIEFSTGCQLPIDLPARMHV
ncbi:hypothetical protein [Desulfatitalea alkaliphila]|uniref:Uncharacterized protein n=1 Tax=Desulfatitalea alkaliphila TaxID=2929485 RepID=A0AA41R4S0_9BACT|nr:hypothetical protein [Desulfatitalea alkaliphila]MCJ8502834.1 hypothetical protein [Desulfatitalea alkaliphila]